ncbi:MAG: ABC transporter permease [Acidobacteria bacterium]|nr:ABC transporter permease [Acidobacteriota bacterium]
MTSLWNDIRFAVRLLTKNRGFTVVVILVLALGIGANSAIFTVVNSVLLRALPYPDADQLVYVFTTSPTFGPGQWPASWEDYREWRNTSQSFDQLAATRAENFSVSDADEAERISGARVTANLPQLLRVKPQLGRAFHETEDQPGSDPAVLISDGLWHRRYGADPQVIGKTVHLDAVTYTIIGVLPAGIYYPFDDTEFWVPFIPTKAELNRFSFFTRVTGRLKPGVRMEQAGAEMKTIAARIEKQFPDSNQNVSVQMIPLFEKTVGKIRPALLVLMGAVGFVLLIACANVANLLLARAAARQSEFAVRAALGASRKQLIRQSLTESLLLSLSGGVLGLVLANWAVPLLIRISGDGFPRAAEIHLDWRVLAFTVFVSLLTGVGFGIIPALQSTSTSLNETLREGKGRAGHGVGHGRILGGLVIAEIALTLMMLVGAGLMVRSFLRVLDISLGFDPAGLLTLEMGTSRNKYPTLRAQADFHKAVLARVAALPGIESVAAVHRLPLYGSPANTTYNLEGQPPVNDNPSADVRMISPAFFQTMKIPIISGREFTERDDADSSGVIIINADLARRHFQGRDPVGQKLQIGGEPKNWREIVGVVGNVKVAALEKETGPAVYVPIPQNTYPNAIRSVFLVIRTRMDPSGLSSSVRSELRKVDPDQAVSHTRTMQEVLDGAYATRRLNMALLGLFAGIAAVLAAVGIYGVMSYSVAQRTHEIGVRMALGARPADVLELILGRGLTLSFFGVLAGVAGSLALTGVLKTVVFGVSAADPLTIFIVGVSLSAVAVMASWIPARRAMRVNPVVALKYE